jgi:hypothetical protein
MMNCKLLEGNGCGVIELLSGNLPGRTEESQRRHHSTLGGVTIYEATLRYEVALSRQHITTFSVWLQG